MGCHLPVFMPSPRDRAMDQHLKTERLVLRPFRREHADAVCALIGNWKVARMLSRVPHPYTRDLAEAWIASHETDRRNGDEVTFCIELNGGVIGAVGHRRNSTGVYVLGYWLGEPWWGKGYTAEAAREAVRFAFDELGAEKLLSGHFVDNPASGRVLEKCGFRYTGDCVESCEARGEAVEHRNFECTRDDWQGRAEVS